MDNLFDNWNNVKKDINNKRANINIKEGCVYWINVGFNVGCEVNGKGENFARPVLVLKKIYINNTHHYFIGIPLTTKKRTGFLYHRLTNKKDNIKVTAMLGQIRIFDIQRVINYHYKANKDEFISIKEKTIKLLSPSIFAGKPKD